MAVDAPLLLGIERRGYRLIFVVIPAMSGMWLR